MSGPPQIAPTRPADKLWAELAPRLRWTRGFGLFLLFVAERGLADDLRQRVASVLRERRQAFKVLAPAPGASVTSLLEPVVPGTALWIDAQFDLAADGQAAALERFALRLNERRARLENVIAAPVVVVLPAGWRARFRELAPDLWHVRKFSEELFAPTRPVGEDDRPPVLPAMAGLSAAARTRVENWRRLLERVRVGELRAEQIELAAGRDALRALAGVGQLPQALEVAEQVLELTRQRQTTPDADERRGLRDLSVALGDLAQIALTARRLPMAEDAARQALAVDRQRLEQDRENRAAQRDLSVSLERLGDIAQAQGRLADAAARYEESLKLSRALAEALGTPEAQQDLSVSLDNIGEIAQAQGRLADAAAHYEASLNLRRALAEAPGTPEAQRDLSVSLNKLGDIAQAQGRLADAAAHYEESLKLSHALAEALGTPEAQRDLSVSLERLGDIARAQGRLADAAAHYEESLKLSRALAELLGTSQAQRERDQLAAKLELLLAELPAREADHATN